MLLFPFLLSLFFGGGGSQPNISYPNTLPLLLSYICSFSLHDSQGVSATLLVLVFVSFSFSFAFCRFYSFISALTHYKPVNITIFSVYNFTFSLYYTLLPGEYSCAFITAISIVMETDVKVLGWKVLKCVCAHMCVSVLHVHVHMYLFFKQMHQDLSVLLLNISSHFLCQYTCK